VAVSIWAYRNSADRRDALESARHGGRFSSRLAAVTIMPLVILGLTGLFNVLPKLTRGERTTPVHRHLLADRECRHPLHFDRPWDESSPPVSAIP